MVQFLVNIMSNKNDCVYSKQERMHLYILIIIYYTEMFFSSMNGKYQELLFFF